MTSYSQGLLILVLMYSDPNRQREFMRERYRLQYWIDDEFRELEAERKAAWYWSNWDRINKSRRERAAANKKSGSFKDNVTKKKN